MFDNSFQPEEGGLRSLLNRHRVPVAVGVVVLAGLAIVLGLRAGNDPPEQGGYYSIDDGQTFFESSRKVAPFSYHGSEAVTAIVYSCDGGKTKQVAYLQKFTAEGKQKAEENDKAKRAGAPKGLLLKKPGAAGSWVAADDPANALAIGEIRQVHCPNKGKVMMFLPG